MQIQNTTLAAVELPPDGVEQRHVVGGRAAQIEVEMAGQQLVFEHGV